MGCNKTKPDTQTAEKPIPVQVAQVTRGVLADATTVTGKLEALDVSNVVPGGAGGKVESVHVELGDRVTKGQTLVTLDQSVILASVRQTEQGLNQARQGVVQAQSALEVAKINYEQAAANYARGKELYDAGVIPLAGPTGFEIAFEIPYKQAKIDYEQIKPTGIATAQAAVATAQAAVDMAREQYNQTFINAPIGGMVTAVNVNPGEFASAGSPVPVVALANLDQVVVQAAVAESIVNTIKQGQQVPVLISAVAKEPLTGIVTNIAPAADKDSKAYPIKVKINNPDHLLKPGMFAEIQFPSQQPETLLVPREAVVKISGRDTVWVVAEDNHASSRQVTAGHSDGEKIQITAGLEVGEQVVTVGQGNLQENKEVEILPESGDAGGKSVQTSPEKEQNPGQDKDNADQAPDKDQDKSKGNDNTQPGPKTSKQSQTDSQTASVMAQSHHYITDGGAVAKTKQVI